MGEDGVLITDDRFRWPLAWDQVAAVEQDASDPDDVQTTIAGLNGQVIDVPTAAVGIELTGCGADSDSLDPAAEDLGHITEEPAAAPVAGREAGTTTRP